ncbi:MAG: tetratricopeptide repeat protein [Alphaproteobacteria bacterium]|nr:tetratricopeptide repeat protein [Alphaproteobacteria bacterium]
MMRKIAGRIAVAVVAGVLALPALAVDNAATQDKPDLAPARAKIDANDFAGAIGLLTPLLTKYQDPDVYNLLGFSYRKSGDQKQAATFYQKALDTDPNFKPTLEYQGEMFLMQGNMDGAKANLAKLATLCPSGCEEKDDLEKAIAAGAPVN